MTPVDQLRPLTMREVDDIERRAREQLSYHRNEALRDNCQRCAAMNEILRLVATIRAAQK